MSTPSFGQPPAFGAPAVAGPPEPPSSEPPRGRRTVVVAVAAGVLSLGVLGGVAALVIGGGDGDDVSTALPPAAVATVEPSAAPSAPAAPLPTAAVQGRNVFVPLVEADSAASGPVPDPVAAAAPATAPTAIPVPTRAPTSSPLLLPLPAVTQTVAVPGPVVTQTLPGPTVTATTAGPVQMVDRFAYGVEVVSVTDPDPIVTGDSTAVFRVNGTDQTVKEGAEFLEVFKYLGYTAPVAPSTKETVRFDFGSSSWSLPTGSRIGLGPR